MKAFNKSKKIKHSFKKYKTKKIPYSLLSYFERYGNELIETGLNKINIKDFHIPKKKKPFSSNELMCEDFGFDYKNVKLEPTSKILTDKTDYRGEYYLGDDFSLSFITGELYFMGGKYNQYEIAIKKNGNLCSGVSRPYTHKQVRTICKRLKNNKNRIKNFINKIS